MRLGLRKVVFVWSAAGSGKTSLLSDWALSFADDGLDVAWFDGGSLPDSLDALRIALGGPSPSRADGGGVSHVVFIDDVHLASGALTGRFIAEALEDLPDDTAVVISGRFQPFGGLTYLEASGASLELRTSDLAFTAGEAAGLAARHDCALDDDVVDVLVRRTGGWATALALAIPWLGASVDPRASVARFDGDHRAVADYLVVEVLGTLDDDEQAVLIRTALREYVPLGLVAELGGRTDAAGILHRISRANTLVIEEPDGYRFHPVLFSFLQAEARRRDADAFTQAHVHAYRWFAEQGFTEEAVEEATNSGDRDTVVDAIERFGLDLILTGETMSMLRAVSLLPLHKAPLPALATHLLFESPDFSDSIRASHLFSEAFQHDAPRTTAEATWFAVVLALHCLDPNASTPMALRLDRLRRRPIAELRRDDLALDLLITTAEGWAIAALGDVVRGSEVLRETAASAHRAGFFWLFLVANELGARAANLRGEWDTAAAWEDRISAELLERSHPLHDRVRAAAAVIAFARAYRRLDALPYEDLDTIVAADPLGTTYGLLAPARMLRQLPRLDSEPNPRSALEELDALLREHGAQFPRVFAPVAVRMVSLRLTLDGRSQAQQQGEALRAVFGDDSLESALIRFVLDFPDYYGHPMEEQLAGALGRRTRSWAAGTAVGGELLLAECAERLGRHSEVDRRITNALRLARRAGALQPFLARQGEGIRLLEPRIGRLGGLDRFAADLREKALLRLPRQASASLAGGTLTAREHEILNELPVHQSIAEIASKQSLSVNTVKTHLRSIYQKLGVSDRASAVAAAKYAGML